MNHPKIKRGIYKIINKTNGKFYIGSSSNIRKRWWEHKKHLKLKIHSNIHLQRAWNEYGEGSFIFEIYEELPNNTEKEIFVREQELIDLYFDNGDKCYNISKTTDRPDSEANKKPIYQLDKNTKQIIKEWPSAVDVERELDLAANCIYNACKGKLITFGGYRWKYKELSLSSKYEEKDGYHGGHNRRKVKCLNDNKIFDSLLEASKYYKIRYTEIISVCAKRRNHIKGLMFEYYNNEFENEKRDDNLTKEMDLLTQKEIKCLICNVGFGNMKKLATHIQFFHKIKTEEYTINYILSGVAPKCAVVNCENKVRYVSFGFKKFCKEHSNLAESEAGKKGSDIKKSKIEKNLITFENKEMFDEYLYGSIEKLKYKNTILSSKYIQTLTKKQREDFVEPLFVWFRTNGFPYEKFTIDELKKDFDNLCNAQINVSANGELSNKILYGNKIFWHFQGKNFHSVKARNRDSIIQAFNKDEKLKSVIQNRLGITYKECFNITGAMLRQGFRSSGLCSLVSIFNSAIAKYIWNHAPENGIVYDYSMGFGQRMLGALANANNLTYIATDPWEEVVEANKQIVSFLNKEDKVKLFNIGAESFCPKEYENGIDLIFSSPPYFDKEIYDNGQQIVAKNDKKWFINVWWNDVVKNCFKLLKNDGIFAVNMYDKLIEPINNIILSQGFKFWKKENIFLSRSHLTKKHTENCKLEPILFYKK